MKMLLISICLMSLSAFATSEFERGYQAGKASCQNENYFVCSADISNPKLTRRSLQRGIAIKELYDVCLSPSQSVYRNDCRRILEDDGIFCKEL